MLSAPWQLHLHENSTLTKTISFFVAVGGKHDFYICQKKEAFFSIFEMRRLSVVQKFRYFETCENLTLTMKSSPGGQVPLQISPWAHLRLQRLWCSAVVCCSTCSPSRLGCLKIVGALKERHGTMGHLITTFGCPEQRELTWWWSWQIEKENGKAQKTSYQSQTVLKKNRKKKCQSGVQNREKRAWWVTFII